MVCVWMNALKQHYYWATNVFAEAQRKCHRIHSYRNRIPFTFLFNSHKIQNHAASLSHCDLNWNSINYPAEISTRARTRQKPTYIRTKNMNVIRAIICYFHKMRVIYYNQKKKEIEIISSET